ncbi:MAG: IS200/IS605 family transposase [Desulfocapsaceae bacterium]
MAELIRKSHNVSILMYHFVCVAKYRRLVISDEVDHVLRDVCEEISKRFEMRFLEIGTDGDHVHFLIQSVPSYSAPHIVRKLKSITAREIFSRVPEVKKQLWGGEFWTDGYFVSTVGEHANEDVIRAYIQKHGDTEEYNQLHKEEVSHKQLTLF